MIRFILIVCLLAGFTVPNAASLFAQEDYIPEMPQDFSKVDMYLQTAGIGEEVYMAFGHTLLRVVDHVARTDVLFNWGVFDFRQPGFLSDFVYGEIDYRMAAQSMRGTIVTYQRERRSLWQEKLNFTNKQKETIMKLVIHQSQPENLFFRYHYYFVNCSTKVRDNINEALSQNVSKSFFDMPGAENLRTAVRSHFYALPFFGLATEILMNGDLEKQMTAWQEMFLPARLRKYLLTMPQFDDQGKAIPGTKLLTDTVEILYYPEPKASPLTGFQFMFLALTLPLLLGGILLYRNTKPKLAMRILGLCAITWGLFSGFFGTAMAIIWAFFKHVHGYHSANLWLFWPVDIIWIWYGCLWLKNGTVVTLSAKMHRLLYVFMLGHLVAIGLFFILYVTGILIQDVSNVLLYLAPITVLLIFVSERFGLRKGKA